MPSIREQCMNNGFIGSSWYTGNEGPTGSTVQTGTAQVEIPSDPAPISNEKKKLLTREECNKKELIQYFEVEYTCLSEDKSFGREFGATEYKSFDYYSLDIFMHNVPVGWFITRVDVKYKPDR